MKRPGALWVLLWPAGAVAGGLAVALVLTSDHETQPALTATLGVLIGWSFIASGLIAWARRPDNGTGRLLTAVGFTWFLGLVSEANASILFTLGSAGGALFVAAFVRLLLAFPGGRTETRAQRLLSRIAYPTALLANLTQLPFTDKPNSGCDNCPANAFLIHDSSATAGALQAFWDVVGAAYMVAVVVVLVRRWRAASPPARRALRLVYLGGGAAIAMLAVGFAVEPVSSTAGNVVGFAALVLFASVPFLFLLALLRLRLARGGAVQLLQDTPETPSIEEAQAGLRRALGDPGLRLLVRDQTQGGFVDADGGAARVPPDSETEAVSRLVYEGRTIAAVVHDPALRDEPELLDDVLSAARLALVKDRSVEALRQSERRNRALLDAIPDNMFRIRGDGTYLDFHSNRPEALTLPPEEIVGSKIDEHMPPDEAGVRMEAIRRVIATGRPETFELRIVARDGTVSDREVRMVRSGDDEVLAITRDITDRKRAEEEVVRQRDFLTTVVNTATSVFCVVTPTGAVVRFNEFCARLTGRADDESSRGRLFWELFAAPEDESAVRAAFVADIPGREHEHRWISASGTRRLVAWSVTPLVDETGEERRLIHGVDVTERRRQDEELRQQYDFLVTVGRATPSLLAVVGEDGRVGPHGVSASFAQTIGYGDGDSIGRPLWELVGPASETMLLRALADAAHDGVAEGEATWLTRDGEALSIAWSVRPIGILDDRQSFLVCGVDVTEQKRQHEELRRSRARIVEAEAGERRRLERNLHDGAQQRLVSLSLALKLAQARLASSPESASEMLASAGSELALALDELRELARGIHPAILTDRGLPTALEALAARATFPVELDAVPEERLPEPVEAAAFYVVSEALANSAKYAHASFARVSVTNEESRAVVEVADDGVGGADPARGSGLRGLSDRVEALDGMLLVSSPPGGGTTVRAVIPLPLSAGREAVSAAARGVDS